MKNITPSSLPHVHDLTTKYLDTFLFDFFVICQTYHYTMTEKELLAVMHSLNKFRHYITGYQTFVHTNHAAIRCLMNKPDVNACIIKWFLLLQQFDLTIINKPGKENVVSEFLSRVNLPTR